MKRVVITGQGTVNPLGKNVAETLAAMQGGRCGITKLDIPDLDRLTIRIGAQVQGFDPEHYFDRRQIALFDRTTQFSYLAAKEAIEQSGLSFAGDLAVTSGIVLGTAGGGTTTTDENYRVVYEQGKNRVHPFVVPKLMNNAAASQISMAYNLQGPSFCVASACASSNHAMGQAFNIIRSGMATTMITGGADAMLCFGGMKAWEGLRVMSPDACRPFSCGRNGMVQGEGAAIFVFEERQQALARGAEILAEVAGFSMTSDAFDIVKPNRRGAERAIKNALHDAKIDKREVDYINAHGTGTMINDAVECAAITNVFGDYAKRLMVSSTKSMHGHLMGGAGAVELLACIMALRDGVIAPTIGYLGPDPECALDVVPNEARNAKVRVVLTNAFAFGGMNAVLALKSG